MQAMGARHRPITDFENLGFQGEGSYSTVYKAKDKHKNEIVALKCAKGEDSGFVSDTFMQELNILQVLRHDHIVNLCDVVAGKKIYLSLEYCHFVLSEILDDQDMSFQLSEIKCIMRQLFFGLEYIHQQGIIHRDVSASNIFFTEGGCLKIGDFGISRKVGPDMSPEVGSRWYRAPEMLFWSRNYSYPVDIWAAGCIFAELLLNKPLFPGKSDCDVISFMIQLLGTPTEDKWPECAEFPLMKEYELQFQPLNKLASYFEGHTPECLSLLHNILVYNPQERYKAEHCIQHSYFHEDPVECTLAELANSLKSFVT